jgi:4-hydroxybenzoate polyprenyltransferase
MKGFFKWLLLCYDTLMNSVLQLLRPRQWTKNFFVLAPLCFSFEYNSLPSVITALLAMLAFILASCATYIINDMRDIAEDRMHPIKCHRPLATGRVTMRAAFFLAIACLGCALLLLVLYLPPLCSVILTMYLFLQIAYNYRLKHTALLDVMSIATGFVLRVLMGAYAIAVPVSPWIVVTTFLLACFLGFGKRYHELSVLEYAHSRLSLQRYSRKLLTQLINVSCAATFLSYTLYAVDVGNELDKPEMMYSALFVIIGLFRYLQVLYVDKEGGEPERVLLGDSFFMINCLVWLAVTMGILSY